MAGSSEERGDLRSVMLAVYRQMRYDIPKRGREGRSAGGAIRNRLLQIGRAVDEPKPLRVDRLETPPPRLRIRIRPYFYVRRLALHPLQPQLLRRNDVLEEPKCILRSVGPAQRVHHQGIRPAAIS